MFASFYKKAPLRTEATTSEEKKVEEETEDGDKDEEDADIEEQLLKLNEQQRKEAKRFVFAGSLWKLIFSAVENVNM